MSGTSGVIDARLMSSNIAAKTFRREIDQMYEEAEGGQGEMVRAKL